MMDLFDRSPLPMNCELESKSDMILSDAIQSTSSNIESSVIATCFKVFCCCCCLCCYCASTSDLILLHVRPQCLLVAKKKNRLLDNNKWCVYRQSN